MTRVKGRRYLTPTARSGRSGCGDRLVTDGTSNGYRAGIGMFVSGDDTVPAWELARDERGEPILLYGRIPLLVLPWAWVEEKGKR